MNVEEFLALAEALKAHLGTGSQADPEEE
jgi:hypothetical protein